MVVADEVDDVADRARDVARRVAADRLAASSRCRPRRRSRAIARIWSSESVRALWQVPLHAAVRDDDRLRRDREHLVDRRGREVREVDGDAELLHARERAPAELGEAALLDAVGGARVVVVEEVGEADHPHAELRTRARGSRGRPRARARPRSRAARRASCGSAARRARSRIEVGRGAHPEQARVALDRAREALGLRLEPRERAAEAAAREPQADRERSGRSRRARCGRCSCRAGTERGDAEHLQRDAALAQPRQIDVADRASGA